MTGVTGGGVRQGLAGERQGERAFLVAIYVLLAYAAFCWPGWIPKFIRQNWKDYRAAKIEKARIPFNFRPGQPFALEFGRGSGWQGLATFKLNEAGEVELVERRYFLEEFKAGNYQPVWAKTNFKLTANEVRQIAVAIDKFQLAEMDPMYIDSRIADGAQWEFYLQQAGKGKKIYFSNLFPQKIKHFTSFIDNLFKEKKDKVSWKNLSKDKKVETQKVEASTKVVFE